MGSNDVHIRPARQSDLDAVSELADKRALPEDGIDESASRTGFLVSGLSREDYGKLLTRADHFYVAHQGDDLVGFVLGYGSDRIEPDEWLNNEVKKHLDDFVVIKQVCVEPDHASRGVASRLYERVLHRCADLPVVAAVVADPTNEPSTRLHHRHGFTPFLSLTPPDERTRTVWIRRQHDLDALLTSYGTAAELYMHEDDLNWWKLNNFLYVTVGLFAAFGFVLSLAQNNDSNSGPLIAVLIAIALIGSMASASFGVALHYGIRYMEARKDAFDDVEEAVVRAGGARVVTKVGPRARRTWLRRSPTRFTLRLVPVLVGVCWLGAAVATIVLF